jgi:hypothetical protein
MISFTFHALGSGVQLRFDLAHSDLPYACVTGETMRLLAAERASS